ncbi:MAG TPA: endolytic transglycosylase MltG [Chitinophagaceae bacterium]|nr:endolytic transglycosylase MltG [Chitinophagaceae bacterium]
MKKKIILGSVGAIILIGGFLAWKFFGTAMPSETEGKYLYIKTGSSFKDVQDELTKNKFIKKSFWFRTASKIAGYKDARPGRYKITKGMSMMKLVRMLKNGQQSPVSFVITKIRTKENLAEKIANSFECDSEQVMNYINNADTLKSHDLDTNTVMAVALPLTYEINWNTTPEKIFNRFYTAYKNFWTDERKKKAESIGMTPLEVSTLASIIDEETNSPDDRPNIASVYMNRIAKGIPLQADPTVKFALKKFELRRVLEGHLRFASPYNTYQNKGLPPGPICTPSLETIDAVLNAPKTDYLYFVANSDFSGTHIFTAKYEDHLKYARLYQQELNKRNVK